MAHLSDSSSQRLPPRFCAGENGERPSEDPIDRLGAIIEHMNVNDEERVVWNREVGRVVHLVRGRKTQLISDALQAIVSRLQFCLADTLQQDIGMSTDDSIGAMKGGYSLADLYELEGAGVTPLRDRAEGLVELQTIVQTVRGMTLSQINRAAARASAALNSDALRRMESERAIRQCETLLEQRVESMAEFLRLLNTPMLRAHLPTTPHLLARAMRRFGMLSVHFAGHDVARTGHRTTLSYFLSVGARPGIVENFTQQEVIETVESLRQLTDTVDEARPELIQFAEGLAARCLALLEAMEDPCAGVSLLNGLSRLRFEHPSFPALRKALLRKIAVDAPMLPPERLALAIESWRRSAQHCESDDDVALSTLMQRGADVAAVYTPRQVVNALHDVAELSSVRASHAAQAYVRSLCRNGRSQPPKTFGAAEVAWMLRTLGLCEAEGADTSVFREMLVQRGGALLSDPQTQHGFGNREVGMSLLAMAQHERRQGQKRVNVAPSPDRAHFVDQLARRAADLDGRHDAISGTSAFSAFAHIELRSANIERMLRVLAASGPTWSTAGRPEDCLKRQQESFWAIARMGIRDEHTVAFARFLARTMTKRLPHMNLQAVSRNIWSCMVIQYVNPGALSADSLDAAVDRADELVDAHAEPLHAFDAVQVYHAQTYLRGYAHPRCTQACRGDVDAWLASGNVPTDFRRHSETRVQQTAISPAELDVREYLQHCYGADAQPDVLHHGFNLDVAVRIIRPGREPMLVDVEVDGRTHGTPHTRHTDALRDSLLEKKFGAKVLRLPYTTDSHELLAEARRALEVVALQG